MRPTEVLPLRDSPVPRPADDCAVRPITQDVLRWFRVMFAGAEPGPEHAALDVQLGQQAEALLRATGRPTIASIAQPLVDVCRAAAMAVQRRQEARRHDIAKLVAVVRETVDSLAVGFTDSSAALVDSTTRLDALQRITNFNEMKELLAAEVVTLRQLASERDRQHTATIASLRDQLSAAEAELCVARAEALIDPLTGIPNRRAFDAALAHRIQRAEPTTALVLAMLDIDSFKQLNDRLGHSAGDGVLRAVATAIREAVRDEDVVARIGGDEFVVITSGLTLSQAESRLRGVLHVITATSAGAEQVRVSASCGASEYCAGDTAHTLIARTDAALKDAKVLGKNRVVTRSAPYIRTQLRHGR